MLQAFQDGTLGTGVKLVVPSGTSYVGVNIFSSVVTCLDDLSERLCPKSMNI